MVHILIFVINIIFYYNKFYYYFFILANFDSIIINTNTIRNITLFYYNLAITIDYLLILISLLLEVNINDFSERQVLNISINIIIKYISIKSIIVLLSNITFKMFNLKF